jgi:hypothetical protein
MTEEQLLAILDEKEGPSPAGDDILLGLKILRKYATGLRVIVAAEHDQIYSITPEEAASGGITREEVETLRDLGWFISDADNFSHFV